MHEKISILLELAACDDLVGFKAAVEEDGHNVNETGLWYGKKIGMKKMGYEERTPLMIAAMYGNMDVLTYILKKCRVDVNRACSSDGFTALHCAVAGAAASVGNVVECLLDAFADKSTEDCDGRRPVDLIVLAFNSMSNPMKNKLEILLECGNGIDEARSIAKPMVDTVRRLVVKEEVEKKEYPIDPSLPDIKNEVYGTDEFRMYIFKIMPCSRAYSHDWTECPFVHPGENARRRDPKVYNYSCVPCPEFRKGSCSKGDNCEYSHGIFECWLHPAQYRTRLCKDGTSCSRKVCFFAHRHEELRPLYASTGSALPSPQSCSNGPTLGSMSPFGLASPTIMTPPTSTPPITPENSSIIGNTMWQNHCNLLPPILQLPTGRFKRDRSAKSVDLDINSVMSENHFHQKNGFPDNMSSWNISSALSASLGDMNAEIDRPGVLKAKNIDHGSPHFHPQISPRLRSPSFDAIGTKLQSPSGIQMKQNLNQQLLSSYSNSLSTSPGMASPAFTMDVSRDTTFCSPLSVHVNQSLSFTEQSARNPPSGLLSHASSAIAIPTSLSDWSSPNGKLDWSISPEEINNARKYPFSFRVNNSIYVEPSFSDAGSFDEADVS